MTLTYGLHRNCVTRNTYVLLDSVDLILLSWQWHAAVNTYYYYFLVLR